MHAGAVVVRSAVDRRSPIAPSPSSWPMGGGRAGGGGAGGGDLDRPVAGGRGRGPGAGLGFWVAAISSYAPTPAAHFTAFWYGAVYMKYDIFQGRARVEVEVAGPPFAFRAQWTTPQQGPVSGPERLCDQ
jgi:hypothetical protein